MTLQFGWLLEQLQQVEEEIRHWPQSMKRNSGMPFYSDVDSNKSDAEIALEERIRELEARIE